MPILIGCQSYKVVLDSDYHPSVSDKKKVCVLGVIGPDNDTSGFYILGHTMARTVETEVRNLLADKLQRYFNASPYFTTFEKIDLDELLKTQEIQSSDLYDSTGQILPQIGELKSVDCIIIARVIQNFTIFYLLPAWWHTTQIELKMLDIRTGQVYFSGYAGGRWFVSFSRELLFESIFEKLFAELSLAISQRQQSLGGSGQYPEE